MKFDSLITLGVLGVGGYLVYKYVWPPIQRELENLGSGSDLGPYRPEPPMANYFPPPTTIIEDRFPDVVYEDRYPDVVYEDRYPDYYPVPYPTPIYPPIYNPPYCPPGRYWNGDKCKKIDIDCPPGYREDDGRCKPRHDCDRDEVWNGWTCVKIRGDCPPGMRFDKDLNICEPDCPRGFYFKASEGRCKPTDSSRRPPDRDRDRLRLKLPEIDRPKEDKGIIEAIKDVVVPDKDKPTPETDRLKEITEKATQSFIEIWSDFY